MPHEWRSNARSSASRRSCATPESSGVLDDVSSALVDRAPIDWAALLTRIRTDADRAFIENLRIVETIRSLGGHSDEMPRPRLLAIARIVVWLGLTQTMVGLAVLAIASVQGVMLANRMPQVALALAFTAACLLIAATASRDPRRLFLQAAFACAASVFARGGLSGAPAGYVAAAAPFFRGLCIEVLMPACLGQFALDFPRARRFTRYDVIARRATTLAWIAGGIVIAVNWAVAYGWLDAPELSAVVPQYGNTLFWSVFTLALVPAVLAVLIRSSYAPPEERRRVVRFALALAAGPAPFLGVGLARAVSPTLDLWYRTAGSSDRLWIEALIVGGLVATPVLTTIAVVADRPFEIQAVLRQTRRLAVLRSATIALVALSAAGLGVALYGWRDLPLSTVAGGSRAVVLVSCAAAIFFLIGVRRRLSSSSTPSLRGPQFDADARLRTAVERLLVARGVRDIRLVLLDELRSALDVDEAEILTADDRGRFTDDRGIDATPPADGVLVTIVEEADEAIDVSPVGALFPLLPPQDRDWARSRGAFLIAPLKAQDGTLSAIVTIGPRRHGWPYSGRERSVTMALIGAAALAWQRTMPVEPGEHELAYECPSCGGLSDSTRLTCECGDRAVLASLPLRVGRKFLVKQRLGRGGMGVVYLAEDTTIGRNVALKTLTRLTPSAVQRLRREARAMAALNHEALATIYGLELWGATPILVVEYFPEGTLARALMAGPLPPARVIAVGIDLSRALTYMHARGVLHRDLKPSNIALDAAGKARLLDFGLSMILEPDADSVEAARSWDWSEAPAGTLPYLSPESCDGARASEPSDLWALAVVILESAIGTNPFSARDRQTIVDRIRRLDLSPALSDVQRTNPGLAALLTRALSRRIEDRYSSAAELQVALERLVS